MDLNKIYGNFEERRKNTYAVVIYLPRELDNVVIPIRERYDPNYNLISSHITLVFPFDSSQPIEDLSSLIKSEVEQYQSFLVELESIGDFYPDAPVIYWNVKENCNICELYYRLYSRLEIPLSYKKYVPHVTIAQEISNHRVVTVKDAIASNLPREKFYAKTIDLLTPLVNDRWVSVRSFNLQT